MLGGTRLATHAMEFEPPNSTPWCTGLAPGASGHHRSPSAYFGLFGPGLAALLLLGARRSWRDAPVQRRVRVLVATGTGTAFLLVALVPVPFARRGDAVAQPVVPSSLYYHGDHLGSVLVVTDANGARVGAPAAFEPWGRTIGASR